MYHYKCPPSLYRLQSPLTAISTFALGSIRTLVLQIPASSPLYLQESDILVRAMESQVIPVADIMRNMCSSEKEWEAMWQVLQTHATSLESLHVKVYDRGYRYRESQFLQPLRSLKVPNFTVQLPWRRDYQPEFAIGSDDGHGFKILRPNESKERIYHHTLDTNGTGSSGRFRTCLIPINLLCAPVLFVGYLVLKLFALATDP
jgi:hypothetical protein